MCIASSDSEATNSVTAKLDSIPLVCITAQVPSSMIGTDIFREVDTYGISIPSIKHNLLVREIRELPQVSCNALRIAESGHPGLEWIDILKDEQTAGIALDELPPSVLPDGVPCFQQS